jgi:outer membrane protein assembly factor BamE (lipoprotein component of BamABCDE complex)
MVGAIKLADIVELVDTKDTILKKYGPPSTTSIFDCNYKGNTSSVGTERWYYIQHTLWEAPVQERKPCSYRNVAITFNKRGVVIKKEEITKENYVEICKEATKVSGCKTTLLQEAFRNIGKFSQARSI